MRLFSLLLLSFTELFSPTIHKDRIEKPVSIRFVFAGTDTIVLNNFSDPRLVQINKEIAKQKKQISEAQVSFKTGEKITFSKLGSVFVKIQIKYNEEVAQVPNDIVEKISVINFQSLELLWDGRDQNAFDASYFYIRFQLGVKKRFPINSLQIHFNGIDFKKVEVSRQDNARTWSHHKF
jgi:hypothetical protein